MVNGATLVKHGDSTKIASGIEIGMKTETDANGVPRVHALEYAK
jgi:hypothetical protein